MEEKALLWTTEADYLDLACVDYLVEPVYFDVFLIVQITGNRALKKAISIFN